MTWVQDNMACGSVTQPKSFIGYDLNEKKAAPSGTAFPM
jgi:hypothetical protein